MEEVKLNDLTKDAVCSACGTAFVAKGLDNPMTGKPWFWDRFCSTCSEAEQKKRDEEERQQKQKQMDDRWAEICPVLYRTIREGGETDVDRLKSDIPQYEAIVTTPYTAKGVLLRGDSGKGKTRVMWRLLRRHFNRGRGVRYFTAGSFERECRDAAGKFRLEDWFECLAEIDCVFVDDLGKSTWSPNTTSMFFDLVEHRTANRRPMFITTNLSGETLLQQLKLEKDIGEPMLRRLREFCELFTL